MCIRDSPHAHRGTQLHGVLLDGELAGEPERLDAGEQNGVCLLYTSDAADERSSVDLGGCRII